MFKLGILFFYISFLFQNIFCQDNLKEFHLKYNTKQNNEVYQFTVLKEGERLKKFNKDLYYSWLKSQIVIETQGGAGGRLLHGTFISYYENKQLSKKGVYKRGLKDGEWIYWNIHGEIERIENWSEGIKIKKETFFKDSKIQCVISHRRSKKKIFYIDSLIVLKNDQIVKKVHYKGKKVISIKKFKKGKLHGRIIDFNSSEKKIKTWYRNGKVVSKKKEEISTKEVEKKRQKKNFKTKIKEIREKKNKV